MKEYYLTDNPSRKCVKCKEHLLWSVVDETDYWYYMCPKCGIRGDSAPTADEAFFNFVKCAAQKAPENKDGLKHDSGKLQLGLLPSEPLKAITRVLMFGAKKYSPYSWMQGIDYMRLYDATLRHLLAWRDREDNDEETGLSHLAHAACNLFFLITYAALGRLDLDDRPGGETVFAFEECDHTCSRCQGSTVRAVGRGAEGKELLAHCQNTECGTIEPIGWPEKWAGGAFGQKPNQTTTERSNEK